MKGSFHNSRGLRWVLIEGRPAHVSWFAHLPPRRRPAAVCPHCAARLTLKLGDVLRHHAAHAPESRCAATRPETALHSDVKYHIAAQLARAEPQERQITIRRRCAGAGDATCGRTRDDPWCHDWSDVRVETGPDGTSGAARRRADVLMYRDGAATAAIEVLVSHAAAADAGIDWVEVRAHEALIDGDDAWNIAMPLPVERMGRAGETSADVWRCDEHRAAHARLVARRERTRAADAERDRVRTRLIAARVVDIYHPEGSRDRLVYRLEEQVDHEGCRLVLKRGTQEIGRERLELSDYESFRFGWRDLRARASDDAATLTPAGAFRDSPMRWATHDVAANLVEEGAYDVAPGDATPLATRYPRRWFYVPAERRWFLPVEMRGVRWDREAGDAFAAHPAWVAARSAVRERGGTAPSATEGSWKSFVFAARPAVIHFGTASALHCGGAVAEIPFGARTLMVLTRAVDDAALEDVMRGCGGSELVWLAHPADWSASRAGLAWAPAGRDARGRGVVVVDGVGVYTADRFVSAFRRGDARVSAASLLRHSAERARHLPKRG